MDVRLSLDGEPIIIHDVTTRRTTKEKHNQRVYEMTLEELQTLDAGAWFAEEYQGEKIPTLSQVLQLDFQETGLMLELKKDNHPAKLVETVLSHLEHPSIKVKHVILGSFSPEIVQEIQRQKKEAPVLGIVEKAAMIPAFKALNIKHLAIWYQLLTHDLIKSLHDEGIAIWAFTVDRPKVARFLTSLNVEGLICNNPTLITQALLDQ